ncbi:MAG: methyl-accepting chemotaxis protein [Schwartzia sp. (in: firmicutes)]
MSNVKVAYKILLLVVVAFVGMAVIGVRGWMGLNKAGQDMELMYAEKLRAVQFLGYSVEAMRVIQVRTYQAIADPARVAEVKKKQREQIEKYEKMWGEYEKLGRRIPDIAPIVDGAAKDWQVYRASMERVMALAEAGKTKEALAEYNRAAKQATVDLRDKLTKLSESADKNAAAIAEQNDHDNKAALVAMTAITAVAMLLLLVGAFFITKAITEPLAYMIRICERLKDGDYRLTKNRPTRGDEFGDAARKLYDMCQSANGFFRSIGKSSERLTAASSELTTSSMEMAQSAVAVADSVSGATETIVQQQNDVDNANEHVARIAASMEEMKQQATHVVGNSEKAVQEASGGSREIDLAVKQIKDVEMAAQLSAELVDKLGARSQEIGTIVDTISGIASQTNLLALNAAIEAARAGEHGRGFAVVAEEVRKLAEQSQTAAQQIAELIGAIQADTASAVDSMQGGSTAVDEGVRSVQNMKATFERIKSLIEGVTQDVEGMSASIFDVNQQAEGIAHEMKSIGDGSHKVADEMRSVSGGAEERSASSEELAAASDSLAKMAQEMRDALQKYRY